MLSQHEDVVYIPLPYQRLDEVGIDESVFEVVHEVHCIVGGGLGAHGSATHLQVVVTMEGKVVACQDKA